MRQHRTIYFNDARHYYLFVFEPPMRLEDAWVPVDEVAGTAVDTFAYGVERGDGLFYPSRVGQRFGADQQPFRDACYWRVWHNMQSLIDRGLDPLQVLVDRAHEKGMEFIASLRMGGYGGMPSEHALAGGGRGFVHREVREHQLAVLEELATRYEVEGVELDFAAAPGGSPFCLKPEDAVEHTPVMTELVRRIADMVRGRPGGAGQVGARVYPTEELNLKAGLDVRTWLREGLVDFVVPLVYAYFVLDADMPIDWLVAEAHDHDASVYGMLQPYHDRTGLHAQYATPAMARAAAANLWSRDVDGLYTWFLSWPLGDAEHRLLSELGDRDLVAEGDKHYFLRHRSDETSGHDYPAHLPLEIPAADGQARYAIPFAVADDPSNPRVQRVELWLAVGNLLSADRLELRLNGQSLAGEPCRRLPQRWLDPYSGQWLVFDLQRVRPRPGRNQLEVGLRGRPPGMAGGVTVQDLEVKVEYGVYPRGLDS